MTLQARRATVAARAQHLRETLARSQAVSEELCAVFDNFDKRTAAIEAIMLPIQGRIQSLSRAQVNVESSMELCNSMLSYFDVSRRVESRINEGPRVGLSQYLECLDELECAVLFLEDNQGSKSMESALKHARDLRNKALAKCDTGFEYMLVKHSTSADDAAPTLQCLAQTLPQAYEAAMVGKQRQAVDESRVQALELLPPWVLPELKLLCERLLKANHADCLKTYRDKRMGFLEQCLKGLGIDQKWDAEKVSWDVMGKHSTQWIQCLYVAVKLVAKELAIITAVFPASRTESLFTSIVAPTILLLLKCGRSMLRNALKDTEKLFVLLEIECHLSWVLPELLTMLKGPSCAPLVEAISSLRSVLKSTAGKTFAEFEEAVKVDPTKHVVSDGTVHPLTSYVVYYIKRLLEMHERVSLDALFGDSKAASHFPNLEWKSGVAVMRIMLSLQANLESKAGKYKDPALAHIFIMNNVHYIVQSVRRSEDMLSLLGEEWAQRQEHIVTRCSQEYGTASFVKVLGFLTTAGATPGELAANGPMKDRERQEVKDRFTGFNAAFEKLHTSQTQYAIPDASLRKRLRDSIRRRLVPAYREFAECHRHSNFSKHPHKYIKYTAEQIDTMLNDFFENKAEASSLNNRDRASGSRLGIIGNFTGISK